MAKGKKTSSVLEQHGVQQLTEYEHARIRTEMYLGARSVLELPVLLFGENSFTVKQASWVPALLTSMREVCDNSLDEFVKAGTKDPVLRVMYNEDELEFEVSDNGRGIPIDYVPEAKKNLCTMVLTEMKTGRNFKDDERENVIGMNGLGGSVVMIVSERAELEIHRSGNPYKQPELNEGYDGIYKFNQKFQEGNEHLPELQIFEPSIRKIKSDKTGTTVRFKISKTVFPNHVFPTELVYSILKEIAAANPTYKIYLNDVKINIKGGIEKSLFNAPKLMQLEVKEDGFDSTFYIVPNAVTEQSVNFHMQGLVNNAPALEGGTHLDTFKKYFALGVMNALEKESKKRKLKPNRSDIEEGLLIYNITKMNAPSFSAQTKTRLSNENVIKPIQNAMNDDFFSELIKKNKTWIDEIYERCAERTNKKDAEEDRKLAKKLLKTKVAKLRDAVNTDRSKCELFITEGDSASGLLIASRDPTIHGILPLRGKIMNVSGKEKVADLMASDSLKDIMVSMNLIPGVPVDRSTLNFGKIMIATDSDEDGKNIQNLICNFLYKFWPELFQDPENPIVYIFNTPFIILEKGNQKKYFYGHQEHEYIPDEWDGWKTRRAKGLGTLTKDQFVDAIYSGYALPVIDDGKLNESLDLSFNKDRADDRKEWMKY